MRTTLRIALTGAAALGMSLATGTAYATPPGPGVTGKIIAQSTVGGTDYILREITIQPGQSTGWHYHDGPVQGVVEQGVLSHFDATCKSDGTYASGDTITESSGPGYVHLGRNLGTTPLVLKVLYALPHGAPLSEDAPNPGCPFQ
ncbi:cupin domain-containing protein [Streptomyces tubercidicus]|uniref:cupin domain-containing protein n=1 Tax=Streptomyces tubercidicus TaxID=47759 RepID=UPI003466122E